VYKEWGKTSIKIDGDEYFIMSQSDILAIAQS
jgi:co-chaperonin GroES (HSP10)